MNKVKLEGVVTFVKHNVTKNKGVTIANVRLKCDGEIGAACSIDCDIWGEDADTVKTCQIGDIIALEGQLRNKKWTPRNGEAKWTMVVNCQKLVRVERLNPLGGHKTPGDGFGDDDEIPF